MGQNYRENILINSGKGRKSGEKARREKEEGREREGRRDGEKGGGEEGRGEEGRAGQGRGKGKRKEVKNEGHSNKENRRRIMGDSAKFILTSSF